MSRSVNFGGAEMLVNAPRNSSTSDCSFSGPAATLSVAFFVLFEGKGNPRQLQWQDQLRQDH